MWNCVAHSIAIWLRGLQSTAVQVIRATIRFHSDVEELEEAPVVVWRSDAASSN